MPPRLGIQERRAAFGLGRSIRRRKPPVPTTPPPGNSAARRPRRISLTPAKSPPGTITIAALARAARWSRPAGI
ncbi:hypothetical protein LINGRAHAP2_LOCUS17993 [Linum grandiflorum]